MTSPKSSTIEEYIANAPQVAQEKLVQILAVLKEVAPDAKGSIKWGNIVFEEKRILFAVAAFNDHLNFMPTPSTLNLFTDELLNYTTGKGSVQFKYNQPLPDELIRKMALSRAIDVRDHDARWMA
jgi:uncharacterized protein YdhG (YjbR/CyaY superfamily)